MTTPPPVVPIPPPATDRVAQLPLREWGLDNCPAIPYWADDEGDPDLEQVLNTVQLLSQRANVEGLPAYCGLDTDYTIGGQTLPAYTFLYGGPLPEGCGAPAAAAPSAGSAPPTGLPLDDPSQYTLAWTTYKDVYKDSQDLVKAFSATLTDAKKAEASFWPLIAQFGLPLNLLVLEKVDGGRLGELTKKFGKAWADDEVRSLAAANNLFAIDMTILESLKPCTTPDQSVRFAPATFTLLKQDPTSKALTPISVRIWTKAEEPQLYRSGDNAWLWALQAAKTSVTVWGIWIGHVYHWHTVTAAMQMTMYDNLPPDHALWELLRPQSQNVIDFNYTLSFFLWGKISPPTPVTGYMSLLKLLNKFAKGRTFHADDPGEELKTRKLVKEDFTTTGGKDWDAYPVVGYMLEIWGYTNTFVKAVVDDKYKKDKDVENDTALQSWIAASGKSSVGNVKGLPDVKSRAALVDVLTSLLYRVNVHGAGGLNASVNPGLSFVANFPPCLQSAEIPAPTDTPDLLGVLPHTGAIGGMTTFVFTFAYSAPYRALIPSDGFDKDPWFASPVCSAALIAFRKQIHGFVDEYTNDWNAALARLRGGKPGAIPAYAADQYGQWPCSIEI